MQLYETVKRKGSVELETSEPFEKGKMSRASEYFNAPAYAESVERDVTDSVAGNAANTGLRLMDVYHRTDARTYEQFRSTIDRLNTRLSDGRCVKDIYAEMAQKVYEAFYELGSWNLNQVTNGEDEYPDFLRDTDNDLRAFADRAAEYKLIFTTFWGAKVEERVADEIEEAFETDVLRHSEKIADASGYDDPEARGIDLWIPSEETGIQVKEGLGGATNDDSDLLARYLWEDVEKPVITIAEP